MWQLLGDVLRTGHGHISGWLATGPAAAARAVAIGGGGGAIRLPWVASGPPPLSGPDLFLAAGEEEIVDEPQRSQS
jgi:hypothetical protein